MPGTIKIKTDAQFWEWAMDGARLGSKTLWELRTQLNENAPVSLMTGRFHATHIDLPMSIGKMLRQAWNKDRHGRPRYAKSILGIVKILDPKDKQGVVKTYREAQKRKTEQAKLFQTNHAFGVVRVAAKALSEALIRYKDITGLDETTPLADILKKTTEP